MTVINGTKIRTNFESLKSVSSSKTPRPKSSRKSWGDNLGNESDDELPPFVLRQKTEPIIRIDGGGDRLQYSDDFDSVSSSLGWDFY